MFQPFPAVRTASMTGDTTLNIVISLLVALVVTLSLAMIALGVTAGL
jgi:hypothetical protein